RGSHQASRQDFNVLVDGAVVGSFTAADATYRLYTTAPFAVTAGWHTITFQGLDSAGGDNTALVDQVAVAQGSPIDDPGFAPGSVARHRYQSAPPGPPWSFAGDAGISGNDSYFTTGNPPAPEGPQVAFLQDTGSFSQTATWAAAGTYTLSFEAAQQGS